MSITLHFSSVEELENFVGRNKDLADAAKKDLSNYRSKYESYEKEIAELKEKIVELSKNENDNLLSVVLQTLFWTDQYICRGVLNRIVWGSKLDKAKFISKMVGINLAEAESWIDGTDIDGKDIDEYNDINQD